MGRQWFLNSYAGIRTDVRSEIIRFGSVNMAAQISLW